MFKEYEVSQVYVDRYGEIEDSDSLGTIEVPEETEETRDAIVNALNTLGIEIPDNWDIVVDDYMNNVNIYNSKGMYVYQLRG